jgi:putative hydrolase of the HAD superfamily
MGASGGIRALLFDLGGVVIEIDPDRMLQHWLPHSRLDLSAMRERLYADEAFRRHERGQLETAGYMAHLAERFEIDAAAEHIVAGWNAILVDTIESTLDLIDDLRLHLPCFAFSNTSPVHRASWSTRFPRLEQTFEHLFLSFELGLRKPERVAYEAVARAIGVPASSILFFDDLAENVEGARAAGMQAVQVSTPEDVATAIAGLDLSPVGLNQG